VKRLRKKVEAQSRCELLILTYRAQNYSLILHHRVTNVSNHA
jgi:hypothetical protein